MKTRTVTLDPDTYKKLYGMATARQRTPSEILKVAVDLLHIALPHAPDFKLKPFQPQPRRSAPGPE